MPRPMKCVSVCGRVRVCGLRWSFTCKCLVCLLFSGSPVVVNVKLEREDEEAVAPHVIAPFFPQVI